MRLGFFLLAAITLILSAPPRAQDVSLQGWFTLETDNAALVFMLRSYGGDTVFDVFDGDGRALDRVTLPERRTILLQYRVAPGSYRATLFGRELEASARPGLFAAMGFAVTHVPAANGKPASMVPDYAPFAAFMPLAMEQRIAPLVAMGKTDFLPPKTIEATTLEFRIVN